MKTQPTIACPHCKKETPWSTENAFRPFCSERCKLIDLGDWIEERHVIVEALQEEDNFWDDDPVQ